jgi:hypothetical protein
MDLTQAPDRYVLFAEEQSRYDNQLGHALPSELPRDGLCRVVVDHLHGARVDPTFLSTAKSDEERLAFLRAETALRKYTRTVGLASAQVAAQANEQARVWCVGEMSRLYAHVLPQAANVPMAVLRTGILGSIVAFCLPARDIHAALVWPFFANDYGARLFAFDTPGTNLERRLEALQAELTRAEPAVSAEWRAGDWERTIRRALAGRDETLVYSEEEEVPPSARHAARLWRELQDDCFERERLRPLCDDCLFCVLPDGTHNGTVSFHSHRLRTEPIVEAIAQVVHNAGGACSVIAYVDEYQ